MPFHDPLAMRVRRNFNRTPHLTTLRRVIDGQASAARRSAALPALLLAGAVSPAFPAESAADSADATRTGLSLLSPSDTGLRSDVAWLVDRGVLSLPLGTWPIASATLRAAWAGVDPRKLDSADADALARVQRAVLRSTDTARFALGVNSARHPSLVGGDTAKGENDGALSFYAGGAEWGGQLTLGFTGDSLTPGGQQGNVDGSYVAALLSNTVISAGVTDRWWGPAQFMSPIMSNAARPIAGAIVRRAEDKAPETDWLHWIGQWGYEISAGRLSQYEPSGTRTIGLRLYTRPWPNVEFGVSRSILWAGEGRPQGPRALLDALLGRSNVDPSQIGTDPSDEISGFDLRVSAPNAWGGSWVGYVHLVGEDEAGALPTKLFGTVGLQAKAVFSGQRFEATFEATDTMDKRLFGLRDSAGPAYQHSSYIDGYYQHKLPIGAAIGGGGELYTLGLAWTPVDHPDQLRVFGTVFGGNVSKDVPQPINAIYGVPGSLRGLSLGVNGESTGGVKWQVGVSVQRYAGSDRPTTGLQASVDVPIFTGR